MFGGGLFGGMGYQDPNDTILGEDLFQKLTATNKFPSRNGRSDFKTLLFEDYVLLFPWTNNDGYYGNNSERCVIYVFDLKKATWSTARNTVPGDLLNFGFSYSISLYGNKVVAIGHYSIEARERGGGLFGAGARQEIEVVSRAASVLDIFAILKTEDKFIYIYHLILDGQIELQRAGAEITNPLFNRTNHSANVYGHLVLLFGGAKGENNQVTNELALFDLEHARVQQLPEKYSLQTQIPCARMKHKSVICDGKLFIYGGVDSRDIILNDMWSLDLKSFEWTKIDIQDSLCTPRNMPASVAMKNKIIFLDSNKVFTYEPEANNWESMFPAGSIPKYNSMHTLEIYQNKLLFGSNNNFYTLDIGSDLNQREETKIESQSKPSSMKTGLRKFFQEKPFSDVAFEVEGQHIPAHRGFLAARCSYFNKVFTSGLVESSSKVIALSDMKAKTFHALLEFLYCEELTVTLEIAKDLIKISEEFLLPGLKLLCEKYLIEQFKVENVIELVQLAEMYEAKELEKGGLKFIAQNLQTVMEHNDIRQLSDSCLLRLFSHKIGPGNNIDL